MLRGGTGGCGGVGGGGGGGLTPQNARPYSTLGLHDAKRNIHVLNNPNTKRPSTHYVRA